MGSRSFFHYSDITTIVSRGCYVGIDPLEVIETCGRQGKKGWSMDLGTTDVSGDAAAIIAEANQLFSQPDDVRAGFDATTRGAMFRLPLRRAHDVQREVDRELEPLAAEIPVERAGALMTEWAELAPRLLIFLSSVTRVVLWRWEDGAARPECLAHVRKEFGHGTIPFPRLPPALPEAATRSYRKLAQHLASLTDAQRAALSALHLDVIQIMTSDASGSGGPASGSASSAGSTSWLVAQRFDAVTPEMIAEIRRGCEAVPVVGIALPLTGNQQVVGVPFCFLPVGSLSTGLPVHVNGAFASQPNRRELWLPGKEVDGKHASMAQWNDALMRYGVPSLWLEVLHLIGPRRDARLPGGLPSPAELGRAVLARLPDLDQVEPAWRACGKQLYRLLTNTPLLPHPVAPFWVPPSQALTVRCPTEALEAQRVQLGELYARCPQREVLDETRRVAVSASAPPGVQQKRFKRGDGRPIPNHSSTRHIVLVPRHVQAGCEARSGLLVRPVEEVLQCVLRAARRAQVKLPVEELQPVLLALLAYAGTAFSANDHKVWRSLLNGVAWVDIKSGEVVELVAAFAPSDRLQALDLEVVARHEARLGGTDAAMIKAAIQWGLKDDLTWKDCVLEAEAIAKSGDRDNPNPVESRVGVEWASRLLAYIRDQMEKITAISQDGLEPKSYQKQLSRIAFHPARRPHAVLPASADEAPQGTAVLRAPHNLQGSRCEGYVWAVSDCATSTSAFLSYAKPSKQVVADQLVRLASLGEQASSDQLTVLAPHLLKAACQLAHLYGQERGAISLDGDSSEVGDPVAAQLAATAWIPGTGLDGDLRLFSPERVAYRVQHDLWPRFGRLPDAWTASHKANLAHLLRSVGVRPELSTSVLSAELASMARSSSSPALSADLLHLSVRLATELATNVIGSRAPLRDEQVFV